MDESNFFEQLLTALNPSAIYVYSWLISACFTFFLIFSFAVLVAGQSLSHRLSLVKGDLPKLTEMWARSGSSTFLHSCFVVLTGLSVLVINGIYSMLDSISLFTKYAHSFLYAVIVITGPIFIALSAWKSSDFRRAWTKLLVFVLAWPIFLAILMSLLLMIAIGIKGSFDNYILEGAHQIKIIMYAVLMVLCLLLAAITITIPTLTLLILNKIQPLKKYVISGI